MVKIDAKVLLLCLKTMFQNRGVGYYSRGWEVFKFVGEGEVNGGVSEIIEVG